MTSGERAGEEPRSRDGFPADVPAAVRLAVQRAATRVAPDERVAAFAVDAETDGDVVVLTGVVGDARARRAVVDAVERAVPDRRVRDELATLAGSGEARTTARRVVPVRGEPDGDAEQVTQARYGTDLRAYDRRDSWRRVRTPDGYIGWMDADALAEPGDSGGDWEADAVVTSPAEPAESNDGLPERIPAGTPCRIEPTSVAAATSRDGTDEGKPTSGTPTIVSFRTGATAVLDDDAIRRQRPVGDGETVVDAATQFLGTPYEWGGTTITGIDCSGLVLIAYAVAGVSVPRDADQQETLGVDVDREALAPGDLLFWPGHVAISLGGAEFVHAYGDADGVTVNSLDPADDRYVADLDEGLRSTRRLLDLEPANADLETGGDRR
ncbi:NlpC/P60 family protein [Halovivax sp.]|uniref:NlpC/P60 family protein n=1 Tax=Halovivax sp. TaxID=1935978 RepID=UPI0025B9563C|nr:NlpC/P60 family protein [Halovivax sp.]